MARIRSKNTTPEKTVRHLLFSIGYRYRIHRKDLPGNPDIVFFSRHKAIFINGCFWHQHPECNRATIPATNRDYWISKLERNRTRDKKAIRALQLLGWSVLTLWECELSNVKQLRRKITQFLGPCRFF
ncbi:MAG: DNA mismatch endonuclease Vsr [Rhodocyclaceae bacterium]|nr:DNA mismatch endonuclease Vsr [Rhodocyclaceae bacterium]